MSKKLLFSFLTFLSLCIILIAHFWDYQYFDVYTIEYAISYYVITFFIIKYFFKSGLLSIEALFNIFGLLYSNYHIAQFVTLNEQIPKTIGLAMLLSHLSIFVFNISFTLFSSSKKFCAHSNNKRYDLHTQNVLLTLLLALCIATEFYVVFKQIGIVAYFSAERGGKALMMADYSRLSFYKFAIPLVSCASLYNFFSTKNKYSLSLFFISITVALFNSIISASRAEMLSLFLPVLFLLKYFGKIHEKTVIVIGFIAIVLFGAWKSLFWGEFELSFDSEFNTWYDICNNVLRMPDRKLLYGESYLTTMINLIIPFTDSHTLSTWYMENFELDVLARGGGRGFSAVLEAYMNFDLIGIFLIYGFYGWLISRLNTKTTFSTLVYMIVMISIFQFFRSESYSLWKNMMWFKIYPLALIYYISSRIRL